MVDCRPLLPTTNYKLPSSTSYQPKGKHGSIKLSKANCVAKSNGFNGLHLQTGKKTPKRRNIWLVESNETGGGVNSVKYSRGTGQEIKQGISQLSFDSAGIESVIGNTASDLRQSGLS